MKSASMLLAVGSMLTASAMAQTPSNTLIVERPSNRPTAIVYVTSADFASAHSRVMLSHRIRDAIELVCGSYATIESYQMPERDACWSDARQQATSQLRLAENRKETLVQLAAK